jgi:alkylmercury lyase
MTTDKSVQGKQCSCALTPREIEVLKYIFQTILKLGRAPTIREMRFGLEKSDGNILRILNELEKKDILLRKGGTQEIVSIYPFSLKPTEHQILLENGKRLFAMCAVDVLGMPIMFNKSIKVISQCEKCKETITIEIKNEEIVWVSHPDIMIWSPWHQIAPAAETSCPSVDFFCCKKHLEEWTKENPDLNGKISEIKQAFPRIKQCWKTYGAALGFR